MVKGDGSDMAKLESGYNLIWGLNVQGVVNHFLWKAGHDLLPTRLNIFKKNITKTNLCPVCEKKLETTVHALWSYPAASDV